MRARQIVSQEANVGGQISGFVGSTHPLRQLSQPWTDIRIKLNGLYSLQPQPQPSVLYIPESLS